MVKHLTSFIRDREHCHGCYYRIDIQKEIQDFKRKNPRQKPKIIFDFMACLCMANTSDEWDVLTGGRQLKCVHLAKEFCKRFKELDVELVFFIDGPIKRCKIPTYIESSNSKYEFQKTIFESIRNGEKVKYYNKSPKMSVYINNFLLTIREYSKISISFSNECDADIANYATQVNALAVVTCDTDFLIFPGDWQIWLSKTFDLKTFKICAWNKFNLRRKLNLKQNHMPIFSILSGNDFVKYEYVQYLHNAENDKKPKQKILAEYILKEFPRGVPFRKDQFDKLVNLVYNKGENNIKLMKAKELVSCSLNFYCYEKREKPNVETWLKEYIQCTNSILPYMILKNLIITVNQSWMDMSIPEFKPYSDLVIPIIRRQMGILLDDQQKKYPEREICFKPNHTELFQIKKFSPIYYSKNKIPNLQDLFQVPIKTDKGFDWNNMKDIISLKEKFELLCWVLSSKENNLKSESLLKLSDSPFLIPMITINYLVKESQITIEEADVLLISIDEAMNSNIEKLLSLKRPDTIKPRGLWISTVYNRLFEICRSSLAICGLFRFSKISHFDGFIFNKMLVKYPTLEENIKNKELERIKNYRIYL